ncbi:MAG TPA: hypothetical protein VLA91_05175 [Acidimicrobiia bacterium]|nr:hypothetical protein [Acidimicrobiia bacterium]
MADIHHDERIAPELERLHLPAKPDGPGAAAMLAAGIGIFVLGLMTTLNEVSEGLHDWLQSFEMGRGVGPLAGKTIVAVIAWLIAWLILAAIWRGKEMDIKRVFWIGVVLGVLGGILTFPPVFLAFA